MDSLAPVGDDVSEMPRHLRPVASSSGPIYAVGRTTHVRPGTPYVVSQCVDEAVAALLSLGGLETYGREQMERRPSLSDALTAWEAGDDELHRRERAARGAFGGTPPSLPRLPHPSLLGKLLRSAP
jgi:hypothetical protein